MVEDSWDGYGFPQSDTVRDGKVYNVLQYSSLMSRIYGSIGLSRGPWLGKWVIYNSWP